MSEVQGDADGRLLAAVADLLGTTTKAATINSALREVLATDQRHRLVANIANGEWSDYGDPIVRAQAWRSRSPTAP